MKPGTYSGSLNRKGTVGTGGTREIPCSQTRICHEKYLSNQEAVAVMGRPANKADTIVVTRHKFHFCWYRPVQPDLLTLSSVRGVACQAVCNKMSFPVRKPRGRSSPPMTGDSHTTPFSALREFRGKDSDEVPTSQPPISSPFAALGAYDYQERTGNTPIGDCIYI